MAKIRGPLDRRPRILERTEGSLSVIESPKHDQTTTFETLILAVLDSRMMGHRLTMKISKLKARSEVTNSITSLS